MERRWRAGPIATFLIVGCIVFVVLPQISVMSRYRTERWQPGWAVLNQQTDVRRPIEDVVDNDRSTAEEDEAEETYLMDSNQLEARPIEADSRSTVVRLEKDTERFFQAIGSGAALFVKYGAYRGGSNTFAVVGLGAKALYDFAEPEFECYWVPLSAVRSRHNPTIQQALRIQKGHAYPMLPDMDYGRVYITVVVNCTFAEPVGTATDDRGGQLVLYATHGDGQGKPPVRFVALTEKQLATDAARLEPPVPHQFAYCSPPLYGELHPARMREWLAHHIRLFGPRSHFHLHDAGAINAEVRAVIEPWSRLGFVSVQNVTEQEKYDGYYHNKFLIMNDCLHRTRFKADWTFFFDMDEYLYVLPDSSLQSLTTQSYANLSMLQFNQVRMSDYVCQAPQAVDSDCRWAIEDLLFADKDSDYEKKAPKYAVQGRAVFAVGLHKSEAELGHMQGEQGWAWWPKIRYYHYQSILPKSKDRNCYEYVNYTTPPFSFQDHTLELDTSMVYMASLAKKFEVDQIGELQIQYSPV
ncbi:hypothetical protein L7F22_060254 [Adiantum nelumboides]|nr:hypothetical protein [Adiantum nelumboides]